MNPAEKWKADFEFRRKQSLTGSAKNLEAVNQTRMPVFLPVRLLSSVSRLSAASPICGIRKRRSGSHNRNAGGSKIEAPKPAKEIARFVGIL